MNAAPTPAAQVKVYTPAGYAWCWVLQADRSATNFPMLVQFADGRRGWVGANEVSAAKLGGQEVGTRALWDALRLPEPTTGRHFLY